MGSMKIQLSKVMLQKLIKTLCKNFICLSLWTINYNLMQLKGIYNNLYIYALQFLKSK